MVGTGTFVCVAFVAEALHYEPFVKVNLIARYLNVPRGPFETKITSRNQPGIDHGSRPLPTIKMIFFGN